MSTIVGVLREPGVKALEREVQGLLAATKPHALDPVVYLRDRIGMGVQLCVSHERSALDARPVADSYRNVLSFDGRLDNYRELAKLLGLDPSHSSDSMTILASFRRWGENCFERLCGDWALALWCEREQVLYLARDHAGTRTLYFLRKNGVLLWSTHLGALFQATARISLSKEYVARYLAGVPTSDLTPYEGIRSVRPAHYHVLRDDADFVCGHWSPAAATVVRYRNDTDYEEHFLALFFQAVERRTGSGAPVLAELSGGMDSTSIVCASDFLRRRGDSEAELLDTVSYCDDGEASLDERRYFTITEARRGKSGIHLKMSFSERTFAPHDGSEGEYWMPGADSMSVVRERRFEEYVWTRGYRSILSGSGGDELLGGVPGACPELSGYLIAGEFRKFLAQGVGWSLVDRYPLVETLARTLRYSIGLYRSPSFKDRAPQWLMRPLREMVEGLKETWKESRGRWKYTPRQLENERSWWSVLETLPHLFPRLLLWPEYRYPFLDKDLVNFLHKVPSDQLLRPGRRRSLMRRALIGIVPEEILERKRKAFQLRGPMVALQQSQDTLERLFAYSISAESGFIDVDQFKRALRRCCAGDSAEWQAVLRAIALELWLQSTSRTAKQPGIAEGKDLVA
jgi:asparagine synthase (glutamine-hydrolysing)